MSFESLSKDEIYALIVSKLEDQTTFGFNELRLSPYIQSHFENEPKILETLELFSFGTIKDYNKQKDHFIELSDRAVFKLSQLSIITKALLLNTYKYKQLLDFLEMTNIQLFEQLVIESIYAGVLDARLYNQEQIIKINTSIGRDVLINGEEPPKNYKVVNVDDLIHGLQKFEKKIDKGIKYVNEISNVLTHDENLEEDVQGPLVGSVSSETPSDPPSGTTLPSEGIHVENSGSASPGINRKRKIEIK